MGTLQSQAPALLLMSERSQSFNPVNDQDLMPNRTPNLLPYFTKSSQRYLAEKLLWILLESRRVYYGPHFGVQLTQKTTFPPVTWRERTRAQYASIIKPDHS